jgi:hypothetical protein
MARDRLARSKGEGGDGTEWKKKNLKIEAKYLKWFKARAKYYAKVGARRRVYVRAFLSCLPKLPVGEATARCLLPQN